MPNLTISDLPDAITPLDTLTTFFEVQAIENGVNVSRRVRGDMITFTVFPPPVTEGSLVRGNTTTMLYEETPLVIVSDNTANTVTIDGPNNNAGAQTLLALNAPAGQDGVIQFREGGVGTFRLFYDSTAVEMKQRINDPGTIRLEEGNGTVVLAQFNSITGQQTLWAGTAGVDVPVLRTVLPASGGLEVDNQSTGVGFERVLTTSDIGGGAQISGIPLDNQLAVWTNSTTIEGDPGLTYDGTNLSLEETTDVPRFFEIFNLIGGLELGTLATTATARLGQTNNTGGFEATWIEMLRNGAVTLFNNGLRHVETTTRGVQLRGLLNNAPAGGGIQDVRTAFANAGGTIVGQVGFENSTTTLSLSNLVEGGNLLLTGDDTGGTSRDLITMDPDGGPSVILRELGVSVAETRTAAAGGLFVNNTLTGAGLERVLTTSDSAGGGNVSNTGTPLNNQLAIWTDATTIEGDPELVYNGVALELTQGTTVDVLQRMYNTTNGGMMFFVEGTNGTSQIYQLSAGGATEDLWISMVRNGAVTLFNNGSARLSVTAEGVDIERTGGGGNTIADIIAAANQDSIIGARADNGGVRIVAFDAAGEVRISQTSSGGAVEDTWATFVRNGAVMLHNNNAAVFQTTANGADVLGTELDVDNSGASTLAFLRARNSAGGVRIDAIATTGNSRIVQTDSAGTLEDTWINLTRNGQVGLYFNNSQNLRTVINTSGGVEVRNDSTGSGFERVLTTSDIPAGGGIELFAKTAQTQRSSTTTTTADPDLSGYTVAASSVYAVTGFILYSGASASSPDMDMNFTLPAATGAVVTAYIYDSNTNALVDEVDLVNQSETTFPLNSTFGQYAMLTGYIQTGSAGTVDLEWAQSVSSAFANNVNAGSWLRLELAS